MKSRLGRTFFGTGVVILADFLQWGMSGWIRLGRFALFYPAVVFAAVFGGWEAGVVVALAGTAVSAPFFFSTFNWIESILFVLTGLGVSWAMKHLDGRIAQLERANQIAGGVSRMRARFLDIAAHELRTPVTTFSILLQYTERQLQKGKPVEAATLARLRLQAARLSRLVTDLLDVSRLDHELMVLRMEPTSINTLVAECLFETRVRVPEIRLIYQEPSELIELEVDRSKILQVLSNLLDNAIKYNRAAASIEVRVEALPEVVRISVIDQGVGISMEQQEALFEPLTRGTKDEVERTSGLGLGLFISKGIIDLHGGKIGVFSQDGIGSVFYFELPRRSAGRKAA